MSLDALRYLQDYNARYSGTRANQALVDLLVGRAQQERALQEANARLAQTQAFQSQLQREHLAGMQKNALGELQAREKYKTDALASRNEAIKPVVNEMVTTESRLNSILKSDEIRRENLARQMAENQIYQLYSKDLGNLKDAAKGLPLDQAVTQSQLDPQKKAEIIAAYNQAVSALVSNQKFGLSESVETQKAGLITRLRYLDEALKAHVAAGGTLPSINPIDELAERPKSGNDHPLPPITGKVGDLYGPDTPDEFKVKDADTGAISKLVSAAASAASGASSLPEKSGQAAANFLFGTAPLPGPKWPAIGSGMGFYQPAPPVAFPDTPAIQPSNAVQMPQTFYGPPPPEFVPDALRPSTISPPIGFIGYP